MVDKKNEEFKRKSQCKDEKDWKQVRITQYGMDGLRASRYPSGSTPHIVQVKVQLDSDTVHDYEVVQYFKDKLKKI